MAHETTVGEILEEAGGDIQTGPFGTKLKAAEYTADGVPVISVGEVGYGRLRLHQKTPRVNESVTSRMPEYLLEPGDIVFGRKGAVDRSALVLPEQSGWFLGSDGIRLRLPPSCDAPFMAYQLQEPRHREWMFQHAAGTTMASLNESIIRSIPVIVPSLDEQRAIAGVLGSLDDKIEQNRRTAGVLERLARAIFRAWFVDFEPVHAKATGATHFPAMPQPLFDQLPTTFQDSPGTNLGPIPQGWEVKRLDDLVKLHYGKSLTKKKRIPGCVPVYGSGGVNGTHNAALVEGPGIIVGRKGSVGTIYWESTDFFPIDTVFYVEPIAEAGLHYLFQLLHTFGLETMNTDAAVPGLNRDNAYRLECVVPSSKYLNAYEEIAEAIRAKVTQSEDESRKLAELRDYLLPKLLSGAVRVSE